MHNNLILSELSRLGSGVALDSTGMQQKKENYRFSRCFETKGIALADLFSFWITPLLVSC